MVARRAGQSRSNATTQQSGANRMQKYVRAVRGDVYGVNNFKDNGDGTITDIATGLKDYPYFWTSTSAIFQRGKPYYFAWYVAFGRAVDPDGNDSHGAGAVRFYAKYEGGPAAEGGVRFNNYVRLVRNLK